MFTTPFTDINQLKLAQNAGLLMPFLEESLDRIRSLPINSVPRAAETVALLNGVVGNLRANHDVPLSPEIAQFLNENRQELLRSLSFPNQDRMTLRKPAASQDAVSDKGDNDLLNTELAFKAYAYQYALEGARFVNVLDARGNISDLKGKFYPDTKEALMEALASNYVYIITGDTQEKLIKGLLSPNKIIGSTGTSNSGNRAFTLGTAEECFKKLSILTETGARRLDYSLHEQLFVETVLSPLPSPEVIKAVSALMEKVGDEFRARFPDEYRIELGLTWEGLEPCTVQPRLIGKKQGIPTLSLLGDLTPDARTLLKNLLDLKNSDPILFNQLRTVLRGQHDALMLLRSLVEGAQLDYPGTFERGGSGSIDWIFKTKGQLILDEVLPHQRELHRGSVRPVFVVAYGDHSEHPYGNDYSMRLLNQLQHLERISCMSIHTGAKQWEPLELLGERLLYSPYPAADGGTAQTLRWCNEASFLAQFVYAHVLGASLR